MTGRLKAMFDRADAADEPPPFAARHVERSLVASADDDPAGPSDRLLDVGLAAAQRARGVSMAAVVGRMTDPPWYPDVWPGEHYKLLAALMLELKPKLVIEIGTFTGLSALAIRGALPAGSRLVTFDVIPWDRIPGSVLRAEDFADGALSQRIGDVADPAEMRRQADLFRSAEFVFVDGPKDVRFEREFLARMDELRLTHAPLVIFDDIRVWNMLAIWRGIRRPKLDLTSFGHWSGTGLVDWA